MSQLLPPSDDELISLIRGSKAQRDKAIAYIYGPMGWVSSAANVLLKRGAQPDSVQDTLQDAFVKLVQKVRDGSFQRKSSLKTFFIAICYYTWLRNLRPMQRFDSTDKLFAGYEEPDFKTPDLRLISEQCRLLLKKLLQDTGEPCASMLADFYGGMDINDLLLVYNAGDPDIFKKRKFRCMEKLRKLVTESGLSEQLRGCIGVLDEF